MELEKQITLSNMQEVKNKMFSNHCLLLNEKHVDAKITYCFISQKSLKHISSVTTFRKMIDKIFTSHCQL